jgi:hypothetical protein
MIAFSMPITQGAAVSKRCSDFLQTVLDKGKGTAIPIECQYSRFVDLPSKLRDQIRSSVAEGKSTILLDDKLSTVAGRLLARQSAPTQGAGNHSSSPKTFSPGDLGGAASAGDLQEVEKILSRRGTGIPIAELANALKWAAFNGHFAVMNRLRSAGADPYYVFHDRGGDRGPDMDAIQWLKFNRARCSELNECDNWNRDGKLDRAIELLER